MRINTNIASMNAQQINSNTNKEIGSSLEKLASGHSINKASDDAAGLAIADNLRTQATSLNQGIKNANSGVAMIQMADKAMEEQANILDTVKTKLIQAATDSTTDDGRASLQSDINKLLTQFDNIAEQTNLLALNAAIEAARAGEHGLGFSVVAEEVRSLAQKSAEAAKETTQIIDDSIKQINQGNNEAQTTNDSFEIIINKIDKTVNLISEITLSSKEQDEGMK